MKHLIYIISLTILGTLFLNAQEIDCRNNYLRYERLLKQENYEAAYPLWKNQLEQCPKFVVNVYNDAETILPTLLETATGAQREQYINDLITSFKQRMVHYPEDKNLRQGDLIHYKLEYGKIDSLKAHEEFKKVLNTAMDTNTKLSFNTINTYFSNALTLYYYKKIDDQEYVNFYNDLKEAIQLNIDLRNQEKAPYDDKVTWKTNEEGIVEPDLSQLGYKEKQIYKNAVDNNAFLAEYDSIYNDYFNQYLEMNCHNLNNLASENFEANKDNEEWLVQYYYMMQDKECESEYYTKIENRLIEMFPPEKQTSIASTSVRRTVSSCALEARKAFKAKNYNLAIEKYKCAINEASSNNGKANYALMIAYSYYYKKSYNQVKTWGYKALSYKPGYNKAYLIIGDAYYKGAGQVPGDAFAKQAAGWAAADMARRGGDYNRANQYDRSAPSSEECFRKGVTKGSPWKVKGWINVTTTARCVKR